MLKTLFLYKKDIIHIKKNLLCSNTFQLMYRVATLPGNLAKSGIF